MPLLRYTLLVLGILALRASAQTVACGAYHSLVLCTDGNVMAWGENSNGNVGTGTFDSPVLSPVVVQTASVGEVVQLAAGLSTSYAVNDAGEVWAWGVSNYGQLGNGGTAAEPLPVQVAPLSGTVVQVSAGNHFAIALKNDGTLWSWGYNQFGMLGDNTLTQRLAPVAVSNTYGGGIAAISSGAQHTLALKCDSSVWAWGRSEYGQVGIGGWTTLDEPTPCNGMGDSVVAIAAGSFHSLALKSDGTVWAWGRNSAGQLGVGSYWDTSTPTPLQVIGLSDVVRIAAVGSTSFAVKADGSVWAWGLNNDGLLTMDTGEAFNPTPLQVTALGEYPLIYNGGVGFHALAIAANGDLLSWGYRLYGAIGDGGATSGIQMEPVVLTNACSVSTALNEQDSDPVFTAFPNPTYGHITFSNAKGRFVLYNGLGQAVIRQRAMADAMRVDISSCPAGVYTAVIEEQGSVRRCTVVKQ